jgi:pyruvate dehydrogenase E1 component beta subunit
MVAAIRDPDPVVFMEPKRSYRAFKEDVPEKEEVIEIGQSQLIMEGDAITVVAWGAMMHTTKKALEILQEKRNIKVDLIDLLTISPMDDEKIIESVKKTGRCVIVQEAPRSLGVASEIIARINDKALLYLEAPVARVTGYDVVTPYFGRELMYMPTENRVVSAIEETLDF